MTSIEFATPNTLPAPAGYSHVVSLPAAGGARWADVVKLTFYVVDLGGLPTIRAVRDEFVDAQRPPTSSLVQVAGLILPELLLEVEAVACVLA